MKKFYTLFVLCFVVLSFDGFSQIKVNSYGYVGIGESNPAYQLDILNSSFRSRRAASSNSPLIFNHYGADPRICSDNKIVFYKYSGSGYIDIQCKTLFEYSDATAKENITPLNSSVNRISSQKSIDKIKKLQGVNYTWKEDRGGRMQAGFLAQDVEAVIPEAVLTNDSTQSKALAYSAIIPYLVEAIKEQQAEIDALKLQLGKSKN